MNFTKLTNEELKQPWVNQANSFEHISEDDSVRSAETRINIASSINQDIDMLIEDKNIKTISEAHTCIKEKFGDKIALRFTSDTNRYILAYYNALIEEYSTFTKNEVLYIICME